ncbi:hypothetical protein BGX30_006879, partial [Mortierella sp. GBA39]
GFHNAFFAMVAMGLFGFFLSLVILPWDKPVRPATVHKNVSTPSLASTAVPVHSASTIEPKDLEEVVSSSEVIGQPVTAANDIDASTIGSHSEKIDIADDLEKGRV